MACVFELPGRYEVRRGMTKWIHKKAFSDLLRGRYEVRRGMTKWILKKAFSDLLPKSVQVPRWRLGPRAELVPWERGGIPTMESDAATPSSTGMCAFPRWNRCGNSIELAVVTGECGGGVYWSPPRLRGLHEARLYRIPPVEGADAFC